MELSRRCRAFKRRPSSRYRFVAGLLMVPVHPCSACRCSMKPSTILHIAASTWYLALFSMFFTCFGPTRSYEFSEAVPNRPKVSRDSRNVVWWSTQHPHPAWQRFRQIRRPEHNTKQIEETGGQKYVKNLEKKPLQKREKSIEELYI